MITAVIVGLITVVAFGLSKRLPGEDRLFLYGDYYVQYMQFIKLFLRNLTQGNPLTYSFEVSMGSPTWAIYAYESLSPFNFWFLLISDADTAAFLVVVSKLMFCGAAFCIFSEHTLKAPTPVAIGLGCIYALCGYNISFYYNVQYLDGVYLLPVLMFLLYRFVKCGKFTALTFAYAYGFVTLFYSGYMLGIFSFVVYIGLMWYEYGRDRARYLQSIRLFFLCVLCAVLLSGVIILPAAVFLFRNIPEDATAFQGIKVSFAEFLAGMFPGQAQKVDGTAPAVYSGLLSFVAVPYFFADKKQDKRLKILVAIPLVFLLLCTFVPPMYLMIHGFDATDLCHFRFAYMYSFTFLAIAASGIRSFFSGRIKKVRKWGWLIPAVIAMELVLHAYFALIPDSEDLIRSADYYQSWQKEGGQAMERIALMEAQDADAFYRVYYENAMDKNSASYFGYRGIGYFSSLEQPALRDILFHLGYSTSPRMAADYGSTPVTRMLFAQKYMVHGTNPFYESKNAFVLQKNPVYLPMAYMVSDRAGQVTLQSDDVFRNQNDLVQAMTGRNTDVFERYTDKVETQGSGLSAEQTEEGYSLSSDAGGGGMYSFYLKPEPGRLLYAYFSQQHSLEAFHTAKIGTGLDVGLPLSTSYLSAPHIMPVGEEGEVRILIGEQDVQTATFEDMYFYYLQEDALYDVYRELSAGSAEDMSFTDDRISFTVTATETKTLLFTSIPYDPGWEVTADGRPVKTMAVLDGAFLAVPLTPGKHQILLQYRDRSVMIGAALSVIGLVMAAYFRNAARRHRHDAGSSRSASAE